MKALFAKEPVNFERRREVDLMKFLIILGMIYIHTCEVIFSYAWEDTLYISKTYAVCLFWIFLNMTTATGFMFMMGIGMSYSHDQTARHYFSRSWKLIAAWFLLKAANVLPMSIRFAEGYHMTQPEFVINFLLGSDILMFAGLFFLFMGIMKKLNASLPVIVLVSAVLFVIGQFAHHVFEPRVWNAVFGNFIRTRWTAFPFINWTILPVLGICFGKLIRRCLNTNRMYAVYGPICLIVLGICCFVAFRMGVLSPEKIAETADPQVFYRQNIFTLICTLAGIGAYLSICYLITKIFKAAWFHSLYTYFAKNLTLIYLAQWLIIPWGMICFPAPTKEYPFYVCAGVALIIAALSALAVKLYLKFFKRPSF